jgi:hypothetical protein
MSGKYVLHLLENMYYIYWKIQNKFMGQKLSLHNSYVCGTTTNQEQF